MGVDTANPVWTGSPSYSGLVTAGTGFTATAGNFSLPTRNAGGTEGVLTIGGINFLSSNTINNVTFCGPNAGNMAATGSSNTGVGNSALHSMTDAHSNTGIGHYALRLMTEGTNNVAAGFWAGQNVTTGTHNVAVGSSSINAVTTGGNNVSIGTNANSTITTGSDNVALGANAGSALTLADSNNVSIANQGVAGADNIIRIGDIATGGTRTKHVKCFIGGIRGITTDAVDAIDVLVSSTGQLGTVSSSIRYKENVENMADESSALYNLRPVSFNYKSDKSQTKQYGLIAEEVEEHAPELVVYDDEGKVETVKYRLLVPMLLNELIKVNKRAESDSLKIEELTRRIIDLEKK